MFRIAQTYCAILQGKAIDSLGPHQELKLRGENTTELLLSLAEPLEPAAARHKAFFVHGWTSLLLGGLRQHINQ